MLKLEILRWTIVSGMAAALLRWPSPGAPFWALAIGRPFVVTRRQHSAASRFREASST